ncbi:MAG: 50S ribosomal protein L23 [Candidatus Diapherotrites archaeon]|nr:50S ribosomal protein L23 [Candidatus Diapherotrites archaeon]
MVDFTSSVLKYPSLAEKSVSFIDKENKLVFFVDTRATKAEVKAAVESLFKVKVEKVNVLRTRKNQKKAFVKINKENSAEEIATSLGIV